MKAEVGLAGLTAKPPAPETMAQEPVPMAGAPAAIEVDVAQSVWSEPAAAGLGLGVNVTTTSSELAAQGAFEIVHRRVYTFPWTPEKPDVRLEGEVTVPPAPETMLHEPVPMEGLLAAITVLLAQSVWSGPALEAVGLAVSVTKTSSVELAQGGFMIVQRRV